MADMPRSSDEHPVDRLQSLLLNVKDLESLLTELAQLATEVVATTSCAITVRYEGHLMTVGSSDSRADALDETQYRAGEGPCLEALDTSRIVEVLDTDRESRWPGYLRAAAGTGMRCSLSLPLLSNAARTNPTNHRASTADGASRNASSASSASDTPGAFGAMNLYGFDRAHVFGEPERRQLELFAARAAGTLQVARRLTRDSTLLNQMDEALNSRTVIDQALGIVMAEQRCTASTAFNLIRRESQNTRRPLRDVAAALVERITGEPPEPGRDFDTT